MRRFSALFAAVVALAPAMAQAQVPTGDYPFGTLDFSGYGGTHGCSVGTYGYGIGSGSVQTETSSLRGDGGSEMLITLPHFHVAGESGPDFFVPQAVFGGAAMLVLDNDGSRRGSLTFLLPGHRALRSGPLQRQDVALPVTGFRARSAGDAATVEFTLTIRQPFGSCTFSIAGAFRR